jgi:hypothetical protein
MCNAVQDFGWRPFYWQEEFIQNDNAAIRLMFCTAVLRPECSGNGKTATTPSLNAAFQQ